MVWSLIFGLYLLSLLHSRTGPIAPAVIFNPNCTLPLSSSTFLASPNTRGTLSILWNCLSTIVLCTWNIQHLNIPASRSYYNESRRKVGCLRRAWWVIVDLRANLKWMLLSVMVPEYIMGRALSERLAATSSLETLRLRFGDETELVHAYIMNMGGYYLDFSDINFLGVDVSSINASTSSGLTSTAVDYSGVYFSGNQIDGHSHTYGESESPTLPEKDQSHPSKNSNTTEFPNMPVSKQKDGVAKSEISSFSSPEIHGESSREIESCSQGMRVHESPQPPEMSRSNGSDDHCHVDSKAPIRQIPSGKMSSFQTLNLARFRHKRWALTALQLLNAKEFKLYDSLPPVSPQELESLSNSDSLVKLLTMIQIGWLMIQLLGRYRNNIVSSQLEIATLAFSICSILTYAILWNRPRGVTMRYRVMATKAPKLNEVISLATFGPGYLWTWHRFQGKEDGTFHLMPIPNDASHAVDVRNLVGGFENTVTGCTIVEWLRHNHPAIVSVIASSVLGGTIFGGMHCLAWNFSFPTRSELILWRTCSIVTTVLPISSIYFNLQWSYYKGWVEHLEGKTASRLHGLILLVCFICPYVLARAFLLVEIFRSLFFLPPEAFIDTWPGAILFWG